MVFDDKSDGEALLSIEKSSIWTQKTLAGTPALKCSWVLRETVWSPWVSTSGTWRCEDRCCSNVPGPLWENAVYGDAPLSPLWVSCILKSESVCTFKDRECHAYFMGKPSPPTSPPLPGPLAFFFLASGPSQEGQCHQQPSESLGRVGLGYGRADL